MDKKLADEAANDLSSAAEKLTDSGLGTLSTAVNDILMRLEDVLDGGRGLPGDTE